MNKAMRFLSLALGVLLLCALTCAAQAELVTAGILLTGMVPEADGSFRSVTVEGDFRVYQDGVEVGIISAGRDTLMLNNTARIRIEPVPQSFSPEWDLSSASLTPDLSGAGTVMIPVTVTRKEKTEETPAPTEAPTAEPAPETEAPAAEETPAPEIVAVLVTPEPAVPEEPAESVSAPTPTLPPYTGNAGVTPEPVLSGLPEASAAGELQVQVFYDKNENGNQGNYEYGVKDITVYLLDENETPLTSAVTDADGFALFTGVPEGRYRTRICLPDEWYFTAYGGENSLILSAYSDVTEGSQTSGVLEIAAGQRSEQGAAIHDNASSMSGFCWLEETVDGLYTEDEGMVPGVKIRLKHQVTEQVYESESDGEGRWIISHLRTGNYVMTAEYPSGLMLTRYTQSRGRRSYLTSENPRRWPELKGTSQTDINIGFNWAAQIYGRCYLDANYNGVFDEGELPLSGVKLNAKFSFDSADASNAVSGEDGTYVLDGMRGNTYILSATLPEGGYVFTKTLLSDPLGNRFSARGDQRMSNIRDYKLGDAERKQLDVGVVLPGSVKGTVYYDDDFSSAMDGKEKTVSGFQVTLLDADGNAAASGRTNGAGVYELKGLMPGEYSLQVTALAGYAFTKTGDGNVILNLNNGAGYSEPFRVELGGEVTGTDIGMIRPGTVKGTVFADRNDNGLRDEGENGLSGVTVRLMSETEGEVFRAEIGEAGAFLFDAVMPGRYCLEYILPENGVFARVAEGGNALAGTDGTGRSETFDFATGQLVEAPLCGALTLGKIQGTAYQDHDGSGIMEDEETLSGLTVRLVPSRDDLEEITAVTAEDGAFLLEGLRPDTYSLEISCPEGYVLSRTDHLALPLRAGLKDQAVSLTVTMGAEWNGQKTGAVMPAALSGQLWLDENDNGLFDEGEATPAGYRLTITDESTGKVFDTPVTDDTGRFFAAGMIPGSFSVSLPTDENTLPAKEGDSVFREANGALVVSGVELKENESRGGLLLGVVRLTSVSGRAWIDRGEGIEGLGGMQITMKDPDGGVIAVTQTDANGSYRVDHLMPCAFVLEMNAPAGCVIIEPGDPRLNDTLRSVAVSTSNRLGSTETMELRMDQSLSGLDVGCVLPGRLGDWCWADLNGDGLQAGDEPGIPDVRIELLRDGNPVAETVTDQYGFYRFVDLYPAVYTLRVYAPSEVKPTARRTDLPLISSVLEESEETVVTSVPVTVESNRSQYNADLGFVCREEGVLPAGAGEGAAQIWTPKY